MLSVNKDLPGGLEIGPSSADGGGRPAGEETGGWQPKMRHTAPDGLDENTRGRPRPEIHEAREFGYRESVRGWGASPRRRTYPGARGLRAEEFGQHDQWHDSRIPMQGRPEPYRRSPRRHSDVPYVNTGSMQGKYVFTQEQADDRA